MEEIFGKNGTETAEPVKATISGCLPDWLQGTLLRIGPGMFNVGDTSYNHWFDGMALIHSFTFKDGEVYYQSKFLNSETYRKNMTANRIVVSEFGTMTYPDPCKNIFSRLFSHLSNIIPDFTDNNLINIIKYGDDYYTSSEVNYINKINPETLNTTGRYLEFQDNYRNHITLNLATAHPHYDDEGNTFNMGTSIIKLSQPNYVIFKVPAKASGKSSKNSVLKNMQQVCSVPCRSRYYPSYFHSFGLTENYIIFIEQPFKLDIVKLATAYFRGFSWGRCLKYDKDDITLIHLVNRKTGKVVSTKFYADALVTFHHINAFEEEDHIVFDVIAYKDSKLYDMFYLSNLMKETDQFIETNKMSSPPVCQRFILPLKPNKGVTAGTNLVKLAGTKATAVQQEDGSVYCKPEALFEGLELPRINYKSNGKMYRYFYGSRVEWSPHPNKIGKVDIVTRQCAEWTEDECFPSEPIFVPSPDAVDEDDGVILSSVISQNPKKSPFLLVLDAKTMKEFARATIKHSVHMDIHGIFIPQPDSDASP